VWFYDQHILRRALSAARVRLRRGGSHWPNQEHGQNRNSLFLFQLANEGKKFLGATDGERWKLDGAPRAAASFMIPLERLFRRFDVVQTIAICRFNHQVISCRADRIRITRLSRISQVTLRKARYAIVCVVDVDQDLTRTKDVAGDPKTRFDSLYDPRGAARVGNDLQRFSVLNAHSFSV